MTGMDTTQNLLSASEIKLTSLRFQLKGLRSGRRTKGKQFFMELRTLVEQNRRCDQMVPCTTALEGNPSRIERS